MIIALTVFQFFGFLPFVVLFVFGLVLVYKITSCPKHKKVDKEKVSHGGSVPQHWDGKDFHVDVSGKPVDAFQKGGLAQVTGKDGRCFHVRPDG